MAHPGRFKLVSRHRAFDAYLDPALRAARRVERILDSLRAEIAQGQAEDAIRVRRIFQSPREIFRLEIEDPARGYLRTTLLDREALEELLEAEEVRARLLDLPARN